MDSGIDVRPSCQSQRIEEDAMKALVYHGPGAKSWEDVPDPRIVSASDAIVKIESTTICGTDLHILKGLYSHCLGEEGQSGIGWILGHLIDGTQAEYVRIPYAETSLYKLPDG